jgi:hypothetical protein
LFPLFECARSEKVWSSSIWALLDFLFSLILYRRKPDLLEVLISCSRLKALIFVLHFSHRALRSVGNSPGSGLGLSLGWALPLLPISRQESPSPRAWQSSILVPARARRPVLECRPRAQRRTRGSLLRFDFFVSPSNRAGRPACCARSRCSLSTILIQFSRCPKPGRAKSASVLIISARLGGFSVLKCSLSAQTPV